MFRPRRVDESAVASFHQAKFRLDPRQPSSSAPPLRYNGLVPEWIGRYEVLRRLGAGGFSAVYLARDESLDADVAVKVLASDWSQDA